MKLVDDERGEKAAVDDVLMLLLAVLDGVVEVDAVKVDAVLIERDLR